MNNIYAKTVHKQCSTPHELHPITSARGFEGVLQLRDRVRGRASEALVLKAFSLTKKRICKLY